MIKRRKFYTLSDIRKQLVFTPLLFVFITSIVSIIVIVFILEFKKNNEINLHLKEDEFTKQTILSNYIDDIKFNASSSFDKEELLLKDSVISLFGYIKYSQNEIDLENLKKILSKVKKQTSFDFVIFRKSDYKILYGENIINYLKVITNSKLETNNFKYHMVKNIEYIGDDNLIYWIDNEKRKIRLSYFKDVEDKDWYLGAFSKVDDMKDSTRNAVLNSI